jgi:hypothetical protein
MGRFDHVLLDIRPEPVLRTEDRGQGGALVSGDAIGQMDELVIDGRRVAGDPDAQPAKRASGEKTLGSKLDLHAAIIPQGLFQALRRGVGLSLACLTAR